MSEAAPEKPEAKGVPAWVMTFADLMTLLMCFFVLLLSFSEMDVAKFKQLAGSMQEAFGVQAEIEARTIPKGTSIIAREFSPGRPEPTAIPTVKQFTIDSNQNTLDALDRERTEDTEKYARRVRLALKDEIDRGSVAVSTDGAKVIIHILEKASFDSGSAQVRVSFVPVLAKIGGLIDSNSGEIVVSGHTDDIPISNERFRSNWDLSSARAVSVTHQLLKTAEASVDRFMITGHAETRPRAENDTPENRAKNRRVDISIVRGKTDDDEREVGVETQATVAEPTAEATTIAESAQDDQP